VEIRPISAGGPLFTLHPFPAFPAAKITRSVVSELRLAVWIHQ